ncbi:MAG: hypothetical protein GY772_06775 [bacterium]|nr:hypothetical protein [bacterium]
MLRALGFYKGVVDGKITAGGMTEQSLARYARSKGVDASSGITPALCAALINDYKATTGATPAVSTTRPLPGTVSARTLKPQYLAKLTANKVAAPPAVPGAAPVASPSQGATAAPSAKGETPNWWEQRSKNEKIAIGIGATAVTVGVLYALIGWEKTGTYSANRYTPPRRKKRWAQKVDAGIARRGTEGAFTRQARRAGYEDTMEYAVHVMCDWYNGDTARSARNKKTMFRANLALNFQGKKRRAQLMRKFGCGRHA